MLNGAVTNRVIGRYLLAGRAVAARRISGGQPGHGGGFGARGPAVAGSRVQRRFQHQRVGSDGGIVAHLGARRREHGRNLADKPREPMAAETVRRADTPDQWLVMGLNLSGNQPGRDRGAGGVVHAAGRRTRRLPLRLGTARSATLKRVKSKMWQVVTPMVVLVLAFALVRFSAAQPKFFLARRCCF